MSPRRRTTSIPAACLAATALLSCGAILTPAAGPTGEQVQRAIRRGVDSLQQQQRDDGTWSDSGYFPGGVTCLTTLALLQAGQPAHAARIASAVDTIAELPDRHVYVVSLKTMVLATTDPEKYHPQIQAGARWLADAQTGNGLWGYTDTGDRFDHSNTQFALLGLHAAAQAGVRIPPSLWRDAQQALTMNQNADGGWGYQANDRSFGSMTAAGVANLIILGAQFRQGQETTFQNGAAPNCGKYRINRPLAKGLNWLAQNFRPGTNPGRNEHVHYWLYAAERAGMLAGQRFFGRHDWYREGAEVLIKTQARDGSWNGNLIDTSFAILFLAKGHKAILVQKLQWSDDDAWTPDRYDVPNLISAIGDEFGQPVTWQVVPFDAPLEEWLAAPLLYFHGHTFPQWNAAQRAKLRRFVEQGGTIFAEACCGRAEFQAGFERFAAETFPEVPLRELGPEHAVYRVVHPLKPYGLKGIDLGCRTSVIYSPRDLSCLWEQGDVPVLSAYAYKLGLNICAYAVGRRPLRDRLDAVLLPLDTPREQDAAPPPRDAFRLAQVVYEGDWRPFPTAWVELAQFLRDQLHFDVVPQPRQIRLTDPDLHNCPVLVMSGHFEFRLSPAERDALAAHLRRGGFLFAEACCGLEPFHTAFRDLVRETLPDATLERLPADHPIFAGQPGFDLSAVRYSPDAQRLRAGQQAPELWGLRLEGRLAVVYSPYSLSCGLSGPVFDGCWGLESEDARHMAANIILYALMH